LKEWSSAGWSPDRRRVEHHLRGPEHRLQHLAVVPDPILVARGRLLLEHHGQGDRLAVGGLADPAHPGGASGQRLRWLGEPEVMLAELPARPWHLLILCHGEDWRGQGPEQLQTSLEAPLYQYEDSSSWIQVVFTSVYFSIAAMLLSLP
jgi:hypothetical protein